MIFLKKWTSESKEHNVKLLILTDCCHICDMIGYDLL
jgi:hypothetical protein